MAAQRHVVTIFGSSRPRPGDPEYLFAQDLGRELARAGYIVCNGGFAGVMEASARGARELNGQTIGVITGAFGTRDANRWIDTVVSKASLLERVTELIARGDAYIVLKGGTGTLLEFSAVWEFMNKGLIAEKPVLVIAPFWDGVVATLKHELAWEGLDSCLRYVTMVRTPQECVSILRSRWEGKAGNPQTDHSKKGRP